jgi:regulatory protein
VSEAKSINELNADLFQPEEVDRFADPREVRKKAMDFLARREYGRSELIGRLANGGFDVDIVTTEVDKLRSQGLQSDRRFAESFVQSRINQGKGPVRIRQELKERGLAAADVDSALREKGQDWFALATDVRCRKFGSGLPGDFKEKARQMRFLQYRGFEQDHIQSAVQSHGDD